MNRIKIVDDYYTVTKVGIIPCVKKSDAEFQILLKNLSGQYSEFFTNVKRVENYKTVLSNLIAKITNNNIILLSPIKKISYNTKTVSLTWVIELQYEDLKFKTPFSIVNVYYKNDELEIEKDDVTFSPSLKEIEASILKKIEMY